MSFLSLNYFAFLLCIVTGIYVPLNQESLPDMLTGISQGHDIGI